MSPVLFGFLVIYSPKYSTYDTITEAHVRIHAIEELQPSNHQKLHQHGRGFCPPYWDETENQSSQAHKRNSGQCKMAKTSPRKCLSKKCLSPQGRPAKLVARTTRVCIEVLPTKVFKATMGQLTARPPTTGAITRNNPLIPV